MSLTPLERLNFETFHTFKGKLL